MNWLRWMLAGWCCFTAWVPAYGQDAKSSPQPPRDPAVQKILDDWIDASRKRGPFQAELKLISYDDTFSEAKRSVVRVWASSPESWRMDSSPSADSPEKGSTVNSWGRQYAIRPAESYVMLRQELDFWVSDRRKTQWLNLRNDECDALAHSENRAISHESSEDHYGSWISKAKESFFSAHAMVTFPHLYQEELGACRVDLGSIHDSAPPLKTEHVVLIPRTETLQLEAERIEVLLDAETHLPTAVLFARSTHRNVFVVVEQQSLSENLDLKSLDDLRFERGSAGDSDGILPEMTQLDADQMD